jgi:predicted transcriptional regulator
MTTICIRLPAELKQLVQDKAAQENKTVTAYVTAAIDAYASARPPKASRITDLPEGVSEQTWADFKRLRTVKKAPVTQRALEGIAREAMLAGYTLEAALRECCARGWTGFKADWVAKKQPQEIALLAESTQYLEVK